MDLKIEFRNKVVNGDEVTFDVGFNFEGMGAPLETWDGSVQAYYDSFNYMSFSWNKDVIEEIDMTVQNGAHQNYNYNSDTLTTAIVRSGAKVNSRLFASSVGRVEWDKGNLASSLSDIYLNYSGLNASDPVWEHLYMIWGYAFMEMYNGGNPVYLEDGTQTSGFFNPNLVWFGQSHGSTATYHVYMKIKIVVKSGQSIPSNLRDIFYVISPDDSVPSTAFSNYQVDGSAVTGNYLTAEEGGAPAAATPEMKFGYSPLYQLEADANAHAGGDGTSHSHVLDGVTYYMPNGLTMGLDQFHGTYGLEGHWSFDNGDAVADVGDDGSASNVTFETLDGRTAATFVGSGGIDIPHSGDQGFGGTTTTVSAWFKTTQTDQGYAVLKGYGSGINDMWLIAINENGGPANKAMFFWRNRAETTIKLYSTTDINDGAWHYISTVRDGENLYLYVDGVLEDSATGATGTFDPTQAMRLGKWDHDSHSAGTFYVGSMDDFRIHDRAMDADEVAYWYAETTVSEEQGSGSSYDWTHSGQLTNIVKFVQGQDLNGNRSYAYAKKEDDGSTTLYFTPDLTNFAAFGSYDSGASSIDGSPVFIEYGAGGKVAVGTDTGKVYQIELDAYSVPQGYTLLHDVVGGHSVNSLKYGYAMNVWIFEAGGDIYTIPAAGGGAVMRHTLPAGAKVVDFAEGDDGKVAFIVRLADFSLEPRVAPADWSVVYGPSSMVADAAVATDFNYSHAMDLWVSSNADGSTFTSVGDLLDFLS